MEENFHCYTVLLAPNPTLTTRMYYRSAQAALQYIVAFYSKQYHSCWIMYSSRDIIWSWLRGPNLNRVHLDCRAGMILER